MKYFTVAMATVVALVYAQDLSSIPPCALACISDAISSKTSCSQTDYKCMCNKQSGRLRTRSDPMCCRQLRHRHSNKYVDPWPVLPALTTWERPSTDTISDDVLPAVTKFCAQILASNGASATGTFRTLPTMTSTGAVSKTSSITTTTAITTSPTATKNTSSTAASSSTSTAGAAFQGSIGSVAMLLLGAAALF